MEKRKFITVVVFLTITSFLFVSCVSEEYWPRFGWRVSEPEKQGMDPKILGQIKDYVNIELSGTTSVLVIRNGYIVFEEYFKGDKKTLRDTWSVSKSFTSALIGIAIEQGLIEDLDQHMIDFFPEFDSRDLNPHVRDITIRHLLTMTSGFNDTVSTKFIPKEMKNMLESSEHLPPGSTFSYNGNCPHLLSMIITKATGETLEKYGKKYLFGPLGITKYTWYDIYGFTFGDDGLSLTSRDMAKFGYLYLKQGKWRNSQIISSEWIKDSTQNQTEFPNPGRSGGSYGYLWWVNSTHDYFGYMAYGAGGQYIYIVPDLDLVLVITGENIMGIDDLEYLSILDNYIVPAVIK